MREPAPELPEGHRPQEQDRRQARQGRRVLMKKNKVEWIKGYATLKGGGQGRSDGARTASQTLETKNIIIATGSEARMLPGLQPDPERILTNIEILNLTAVPKSLVDHRRGRGGRGVRVDLPALRHRSDRARDAAAHRAGGGRGGLEGTGARVQEAARFAWKRARRRRTSRRPTRA